MKQLGCRSSRISDNAFVADNLNQVADLLDQQAAASFRARAYREAATYVAAMPDPIREVFAQKGKAGLEDLPTIGVSISAAIAELLETGSLDTLERLRGSADPEKLFQTVPMIGPKLARLIHDDLHVETLEALEIAATDGRLATVRGIGPRRLRSIRHSLGDMLAHRRSRSAKTQLEMPPVEDILDVDRTYRNSSERLPTIKPGRFNETGRNRIPILHTERGAWHFTALYSNSAAAHKYGRTRDWVVIHFQRDGHSDGQATVVTQHGGVLNGRRVVRGREQACEQFYHR